LDFLKEYDRLKSQRFPITETLHFSYELGKSADIELHFQLYCMDQALPRGMRGDIENHFDKHGPAGIEYLRGLLDDPDRTKAINAAYLMAEMIRKLRWSGRDEAERDLRCGLVRLSSEAQPEIRRKSIIALGWVGTACEIPLLCGHLLHDEDALCRAWSASCFLQMCGRVPADVMQPMIRDALLQCLISEEDAFVCGVAIEACGDVWNKKLRLRDADIENRNEAAIAKAKKRAMSLLQKATPAASS
jgi:HEAT repeat protein